MSIFFKWHSPQSGSTWLDHFAKWYYHENIQNVSYWLWQSRDYNITWPLWILLCHMIIYWLTDTKIIPLNQLTTYIYKHSTGFSGLRFICLAIRIMKVKILITTIGYHITLCKIAKFYNILAFCFYHCQLYSWILIHK